MWFELLQDVGGKADGKSVGQWRMAISVIVVDLKYSRKPNMKNTCLFSNTKPSSSIKKQQIRWGLLAVENDYELQAQSQG
jgi:hypothetical protein